jgi:phosphohistidine swiveling domain-containing protein
MNSFNWNGKHFHLVFREFFPLFWDHLWNSGPYHARMRSLISCDPDAISLFEGGALAKYFSQDLETQLAPALTHASKDGWALSHLRAFETELEDARRRLSQACAIDPRDTSTTKRAIKKLWPAFSSLFAYSNSFYLLSSVVEPALLSLLQARGTPALEAADVLRRAAVPIRNTPFDRYRSTIARLAPSFAERLPSSCDATDLIQTERAVNVVLATDTTLATLLDGVRREFFWLSSFADDEPRGTDVIALDIAVAVRGAAQPLPTEPVELVGDLGAFATTLAVGAYVKDEVSSCILPLLWYSLRDHWREIMRSSGLSLSDFHVLSIEEILSDELPLPQLKNMALSRQPQAALVYASGRLSHWDNTETQTAITHSKRFAPAKPLLTEVCGFTAWRGAGDLEGEVVVVDSLHDIQHFSEGAILVAAYTAPEHLPAMKKASAIVTDTGGVLCHAAIVSRELNKPCIVGTRHATSAFCTGDIVRLDVNSGIVRIKTKRDANGDGF